MECTQQIACTQEIHENAYTKTPKAGPKQIGFLGICGSKYPLNKGPNKVGRDPDTCNVVLNDNSISRHHAVINILNDKDFMLMDLDSSNKTKLLGVTLQPYIPHPLRNGDTIQFGQAFGIFRLLEEDDDLPMTQAVDVPDTPVRQMTKLTVGTTTVVPESPDVSDRDDSIIVQSQPKKMIPLSSTNKFIKSVRTLKVGTNKIDNMYWSSSKKSDSFSSQLETNLNLSVGNEMMSPSKVIVDQNNIYDMETQAPTLVSSSHQSSVLNDETKVPDGRLASTIHTLETQLPTTENLPEVFRVQEQNNVQINLYSTSKKTIDIFDAETQVESQENENKTSTPLIVTDNVKTTHETVSNATENKLNTSDEEIIFDEIDCQPLDDICESQPLLTDFEQIESLISNTEKLLPDSKNLSKRYEEFKVDDKLILHPKNSNQDDEDITDCEDNVVNDKSNKNQSDDDLTDCEDVIPDMKITEVRKPNDDDLTDCEDDVIEISQNRIKTSDINDFENLPTQVIEAEENQGEVPFEEMLTQVIDHCSPNDNPVIPDKSPAPFEDLQTQVLEIDEDRSNAKLPIICTNEIFKVPRFSPKLKRKDMAGIKKGNETTSTLIKTNVDNKDVDDPNYYNATQEIVDDLCTQMELTNNNSLIKSKSSEESDSNEKIQSYVSKLSADQIRDVVGVNVSPLSKKKSSDSSDMELTPIKFTPSKLLLLNLPDSQDIKSCEFVCSQKPETDSDPFEESQEEVHEESSFFSNIRRRKKIKQNLSKKFDIDTLPTRAITRIRKPVTKLIDSDETSKKMAEKLLQSRLGLDNTHEVDKEVIISNLARARRRIEKNTNKLTKDKKSDETEIRKKSEKTNDKSDLTFDKKLKQPDIKSMFEEIKTKESDKNKEKKSDSKDPIDENRRSSRNKNTRDKHEKKPPESIKNKTEPRDRKHTRSRTNEKVAINDSDKQKTAVEKVKTEESKNKHTSSRSHKRDRANSEERQKIEVKDDKTKSEIHGRKPSSRTNKKQLEKNIKEKQITKVDVIDLTSQEDEPVVRRSKRKQASQDEIEDKKEKVTRKINEKKEVIKLEREHKDRHRSRESKNSSTNSNQSAITNSFTEKDSSVNLKRKTHSSENLSAVSKKAKLSRASSSKQDSIQGEITSTRGIRKHRVLFTAFPADLVRAKVEKFGAEIVGEVRNSTVVLTMKIRRTFKLLCAIGLGIPIVGPNWVQACVDSGTIVDPWLYLMNDEESEKRFNFSLRTSLTVERNFLKGYNISCTPNVSPSPQEMESIIKCSGGTWGEGGRKWICVSCPQDKPLIPSLKRRGAIVVNNEFILCGVLRQKLLDKDKFSVP